MNIKDKLNSVVFVNSAENPSQLVVDYKSKLTSNSLKVRELALKSFCRFLADNNCKGIEPGDLDEDLEAWGALPDNFMFAYVNWLTKQGYSRATMKAYKSPIISQLKLAVIAGYVRPDVFISAGFIQTGNNRLRAGHKKENPTMITDADARLLLRRHKPNTPQRRRDNALMVLFLEYGFRVGEVASIVAENIDMEQGKIKLYRSKSSLWQTHAITKVSKQYLKPYCEKDAPKSGIFLRGSRKNGQLYGKMSTRAINSRVKYLGETILGIKNLSPHDLRHYWATKRAHEGYTAFELIEAGGWRSIASVMDYIREAEIANSAMAK